MQRQLVRFPRSPALQPVYSREAYAPDTAVVVQGRRGPELAYVRGPVPPEGLHARQAASGEIVRVADAEDLAQAAALAALAEDLKWNLRAQAREQGLA